MVRDRNYAVLHWFSRRLGNRMSAVDVIRECESFLSALKTAGRNDDHVLDALDLVSHHDPLSAAEVLRHFLPYHDRLRPVVSESQVIADDLRSVLTL